MAGGPEMASPGIGILKEAELLGADVRGGPAYLQLCQPLSLCELCLVNFFCILMCKG